MHWLMLVCWLGAPTAPDFSRENLCRARAFRCELRCNETTPGGTLERMRCYERCREEHHFCRTEDP